MLRIALTFSILIFFTLCSYAAQPSNASSDFDNLRMKAEQGDIHAQHDLGMLYFKGQGVPQDKAEALFWLSLAYEAGLDNSPERSKIIEGMTTEKFNLIYKRVSAWKPRPTQELDALIKKAIRGDMQAQLRLGEFYRRSGITEDYAQSDKWYRMAAEQGNLEAQVKVGNTCLYTCSDDETLSWYHRAADKGFPAAQAQIGSFYLGHRGDLKNKEEGCFWWSLAARSDNNKVGYKRNIYNSVLAKCARELNSQQISKMQKRIQEWKPTPALIPPPKKEN